MKKILIFVLALALTMTCSTGCGKQKVEEADKEAVKEAKIDDKITLVDYEDTVFTMKIPEGWKVKTSGQGQDYGIYLYDPDHVDRQIFYYIGYCGYFSNQKMKDRSMYQIW